MKQDNISIIGKIIFQIASSVLIFMLFFSLFFFSFYIHESGHIIFGFLSNLLQEKIALLQVSATIEHPTFNFINLPQQIKIVSGSGSLLFVLGGIILNLLVFFGISLLGYTKSRKKYWWLLFISILIFEISGNFICGTDNPFGSPYALCNQRTNLMLQFVSIFLFSAIITFAIITNSKIKLLTQSYFINKRRQRM